MNYHCAIPHDYSRCILNRCFNYVSLPVSAHLIKTYNGTHFPHGYGGWLPACERKSPTTRRTCLLSFKTGCQQQSSAEFLATVLRVDRAAEYLLAGAATTTSCNFATNHIHTYQHTEIWVVLLALWLCRAGVCGGALWYIKDRFAYGQHHLQFSYRTVNTLANIFPFLLVQHLFPINIIANIL